MKKLNRTICVLLALCLCLGLAACGAKNKVSEADFVGFWEYDGLDMYVTIYDDGTWFMDWNDEDIDNDEGTTSFDGKVLHLLDADYDEFGVLTMTGADTLVDEDGDTLHRIDPGDPGDSDDAAAAAIDPNGLPSAGDPLTETIEFPNNPGIYVNYPELMEGHPQEGASRVLSFNAINEDGTDDRYSNITISLLEINGYDDYMTQGHATAEQWMKHMLEAGVASMCGDKVLKYIC